MNQDSDFSILGSTNSETSNNSNSSIAPHQNKAQMHSQFSYDAKSNLSGNDQTSSIFASTTDNIYSLSKVKSFLSKIFFLSIFSAILLSVYLAQNTFIPRQVFYSLDISVISLPFFLAFSILFRLGTDVVFPYLVFLKSEQKLQTFSSTIRIQDLKQISNPITKNYTTGAKLNFTHFLDLAFAPKSSFWSVISTSIINLVLISGTLVSGYYWILQSSLLSKNLEFSHHGLPYLPQPANLLDIELACFAFCVVALATHSILIAVQIIDTITVCNAKKFSVEQAVGFSQDAVPSIDSSSSSSSSHHDPDHEHHLAQKRSTTKIVGSLFSTFTALPIAIYSHLFSRKSSMETKNQHLGNNEVENNDSTDLSEEIDMSSKAQKCSGFKRRSSKTSFPSLSGKKCKTMFLEKIVEHNEPEQVAEVFEKSPITNEFFQNWPKERNIFNFESKLENRNARFPVVSQNVKKLRRRHSIMNLRSENSEHGENQMSISSVLHDGNDDNNMSSHYETSSRVSSDAEENNNPETKNKFRNVVRRKKAQIFSFDSSINNSTETLKAYAPSSTIHSVREKTVRSITSQDTLTKPKISLKNDNAFLKMQESDAKKKKAEKPAGKVIGSVHKYASRYLDSASNKNDSQNARPIHTTAENELKIHRKTYLARKSLGKIEFAAIKTKESKRSSNTKCVENNRTSEKVKAKLSTNPVNQESSKISKPSVSKQPAQPKIKKIKSLILDDLDTTKSSDTTIPLKNATSNKPTSESKLSKPKVITVQSLLIDDNTSSANNNPLPLKDSSKKAENNNDLGKVSLKKLDIAPPAKASDSSTESKHDYPHYSSPCKLKRRSSLHSSTNIRAKNFKAPKTSEGVFRHQPTTSEFPNTGSYNVTSEKSMDSLQNNSEKQHSRKFSYEPSLAHVLASPLVLTAKDNLNTPMNTPVVDQTNLENELFHVNTATLDFGDTHQPKIMQTSSCPLSPDNYSSYSLKSTAPLVVSKRHTMSLPVNEILNEPSKSGQQNGNTFAEPKRHNRSKTFSNWMPESEAENENQFERTQSELLVQSLTPRLGLSSNNLGASKMGYHDSEISRISQIQNFINEEYETKPTVFNHTSKSSVSNNSGESLKGIIKRPTKVTELVIPSNYYGSIEPLSPRPSSLAASDFSETPLNSPYSLPMSPPAITSMHYKSFSYDSNSSNNTTISSGSSGSYSDNNITINFYKGHIGSIGRNLSNEETEELLCQMVPEKPLLENAIAPKLPKRHRNHKFSSTRNDFNFKG